MDSAWDSIEKSLKKVKQRYCRGRKLLLMGRIEHVYRISSWFQNKGFTVEAILDNDKKKQGMRVGEIPIVAPEQVLQPFRRDVFIIIYSPKYWEEMCAQLAEYGYSGDAFIHVLDKPDLYKNIWAVGKGLNVYRRIQREYGKDVKVFLANCPLGDYYLLGLYFHQYCKEKNIGNYVVAGMSGETEKLSVLFRFGTVKRLTGEENNALIRAWMFLGKERIRLKPLSIWQGAFRFNACQTRQKCGLSFLDTFTKMIFSLDHPVPNYPAWQGDREKVETVFRENGLKRDNTIILSPFAYSLQPLPAEFWVQLAKLLRKKGYLIAVNAGEERESNFIEDSVTLRLNFPEVMIAMELAVAVIGMRSGFFDITARAKCKRVVLYPPSNSEDVRWNSTDIGFCSLRRMGLCEDAYEWEVGEWEEIYDRILAVL